MLILFNFNFYFVHFSMWRNFNEIQRKIITWDCYSIISPLSTTWPSVNPTDYALNILSVFKTRAIPFILSDYWSSLILLTPDPLITLAWFLQVKQVELLYVGFSQPNWRRKWWIIYVVIRAICVVVFQSGVLRYCALCSVFWNPYHVSFPSCLQTCVKRTWKL
jgi:hypothetical protein